MRTGRWARWIALKKKKRDGKGKRKAERGRKEGAQGRL